MVLAIECIALEIESETKKVGDFLYFEGVKLMKNLFFCTVLSALIFVGGSITAHSNPSRSLNRIEGQVMDSNRVPVPDAFVELSNWVGNMLARTKTNTSGRFSFYGISSGRFLIKVLPLGKNLLSQEQDVEVTNQNSRSDIVFVDFVLLPDKRGERAIHEVTGTIYVQDVPPEARKLCESGVRNLEKDPGKGFSDLERAISLFPDYFDALYFLGNAYSSRREYEKAYPYLLKAVDINPRSSSAYYLLGYGFYQLKQIPAALMAAQTVVTLSPASTDGYLLYGTLLRLNGELKKAESILLKAKSLDKKKTAEIYWQLALVLNKLDRNAEAAAELEAYVKLAPDSPDKKKIKDLITKLKASKKNKDAS